MVIEQIIFFEMIYGDFTHAISPFRRRFRPAGKVGRVGSENWLIGPPSVIGRPIVGHPSRAEKLPCALHPHHRDLREALLDRKSTRLNSSHLGISYAVF